MNRLKRAHEVIMRHPSKLVAATILLLTAVSGPHAFAAAGMAVESVAGGRGQLNWTAGTITVKGTGAAPERGSAAQRRLLAGRAAVVDGYRQLAEIVNGVRVDSETVVKDFVVESDVIRTQVTATIKGARQGEPRQLSDGSVEVEMQLPLYGNGSLADAIDLERQVSRTRTSLLPTFDLGLASDRAMRLAAKPEDAKAKVRVAVVDFKTIRADKDIGEAVAENLRNALVQHKQFTVVERSQIEKALKEASFSQSGLVEGSQAVTLGKLLGAKVIVVGSVTKIGSTYTVNARFIDVATGEATEARSLDTDDENQIAKLVKTLAADLSGRTAASPLAASAPQGAPGSYTGVVVDCREVALQPAMSPGILDESGNELYVGNLPVDADLVINEGVAGYRTDLNDALASEARVGRKPLVLRAVRADGNFRADAVLSTSDAAALQSADRSGNFLARTKVVFVIRRP